MCMYIYIYIHTYTYTHTYTYLHIHIRSARVAPTRRGPESRGGVRKSGSSPRADYEYSCCFRLFLAACRNEIGLAARKPELLSLYLKASRNYQHPVSKLLNLGCI